MTQPLTFAPSSRPTLALLLGLLLVVGGAGEVALVLLNEGGGANGGSAEGMFVDAKDPGGGEGGKRGRGGGGGGRRGEEGRGKGGGRVRGRFLKILGTNCSQLDFYRKHVGLPLAMRLAFLTFSVYKSRAVYDHYWYAYLLQCTCVQWKQGHL